MPLILNTHTPQHSFALPYREDEKAAALIDRILRKSGLEEKSRLGVKDGRDGASLQYEFEGGRWSLQDDDDLEIMKSRYPPSSTPSITLHLTPPTSSTPSNGSNNLYSPPTNSQPPSSDKLLPKAPKSSKSMRSTMTTSRPKSVHPNTGAVQGYDEQPDDVPGESLGDRHKRRWKAFHEGRGVRTVVGDIAGAKEVRMLLKAGYRYVYVSRPFAMSKGLIPKTSAMGTYGYAGLVNLGQLPITVGSRTEKHTVMISEEVNFDVVLGRSWMERMGIKTDPLDQTHISYYESGEVIPCDIVVLKDASGQVITVT